MDTESRTWPSQLALCVAVTGALVAALGWWNRPHTQYDNDPALRLALIAVGVSITAMVIEAVASFRSLRRFGLTMLLGILTFIAAVALLVWIGVQPYGD